MDSSRKGKIQTVSKLMSPQEFHGVTMAHEHLHIKTDFIPMYIPSEREKHIDDFSLHHLGWIRQNPFSYKPNLQLSEPVVDMVEELKLYVRAGGKNIVEVTTGGILPNHKYIREIEDSLSGSINIVVGTGFYVGDSQQEHSNLSVEAMTDMMRDDIVGGSGIKAGVVGEVGCSWPLTDFEKRNLKASGIVQESTGCPISIHPGRDKTSPAEILRLLLEAGGREDNIAMGHLDRTLQDPSLLLDLASEYKCYCQFDLFGIEVSYYQLAPHLSMPSDAQRIERIKVLVDEGYGDRILLSQDVHTKHRLVKYGGHGYAHILDNVVKMMITRGINQSNIDKMLKDNPTQFLTFM